MTALLVNYTSPSTQASDAVIVQRYMGHAARRTSAAKLAVGRLLRELAAKHSLYHNDIKWANCCERVDPASGAALYSVIDYQWLSLGRPKFPYGQGVERLDVPSPLKISLHSAGKNLFILPLIFQSSCDKEVHFFQSMSLFTLLLI